MSEDKPKPWEPDPLANIFAIFQCEACGLVQPVTDWPKKKIFKSSCSRCKKTGVTKRLGFAMTPAQFEEMFNARTKEAGK